MKRIPGGILIALMVLNTVVFSGHVDHKTFDRKDIQLIEWFNDSSECSYQESIYKEFQASAKECNVSPVINQNSFKQFLHNYNTLTQQKLSHIETNQLQVVVLTTPRHHRRLQSHTKEDTHPTLFS